MNSIFRLFILLTMLMVYQATAWSANENSIVEEQFSSLFSPGQNITKFSRKNSHAEGDYALDVYINKLHITTITMHVQASEQGMEACLLKPMLPKIGVIKLAEIQDKLDLLDDTTCIKPDQLIPNASSKVAMSAFILDLAIPQRYLMSEGYRNPETADPGVNSAFLDYGINAYSSDNQISSSINVRTGLNLNGWRFRQNGVFVDNTDEGFSFQNNSAYVQHDVPSLHAQLTVGEWNTPGDIFSSTRYLGVQLNSDERMLPNDQRTYLPSIRGIAKSNALVQLFQQGQLIYTENVPPGEFQIDKYNAYNGDLKVVVTEADGSKNEFIVPYASIPNLLRENASRFSVVAGKLQNGNESKGLAFVEGSYRRGMNPFVTMYGGARAASGYQNVVIGAAANTPIGAFAADVSHSRATGLPMDQQLNGQRYGLSYKSLLPATNARLAVAAYQYSTEGFLELKDYAYLMNNDTLHKKEASRFQIDINQPLWSGGSLYASATARNFRDAPNQLQYNVGASNSFSFGNVSASASRTLNTDTGKTDSLFQVSLNIPFGKQTPHNLSMTFNQDQNKNRNIQTNVNGSLGERSRASYNLYTDRRSGNGDTNLGVGGSMTYNSDVRSYQVAASSNGSSLQYSGNVNGAFVFHPGGVTQTAGVGDSMAIVESKDAPGAELNSGVRLNSSGYAVVPYLTPYRDNTVEIMPHSTENDVEFTKTSTKVVPQAGAIVMLSFPAVKGELQFVKLRGDFTIPVGAAILDTQGKEVGFVAQGQRALLRGVEPQVLNVKWDGQQCRFNYLATASGDKKSFSSQDAVCEEIILNDNKVSE